MSDLIIKIKNGKGTHFQKKVWSELLNIKKGEVISYKELANRINMPKAIRAVANAVGKNPYFPHVPCHRVICSDGSLGGYSGDGGVTRKRELLKDEGIMI